jgi:hypothetical protein
VLVVRLAGPPVGPGLAVARGVLLAGLAGLAWTAARAYARMANLAVEAELELGRRERLGRAVLDALPDPTSVLDGHGRVVAANQAWALAAADGPPGLALAEVGQSYPAACAAAARAQAGPGPGARPAAAGHADPGPGARLAAAADGVRAVLGRDRPRFHCRYLGPDGTGPYEVTVTALPEGDGALVTHRAAPAG